MREEQLLLKAEFDRRLPSYWMASTLLVLSLTIVGIPVAILWFIFGRSVHRRQFEALECELTERSLNIRRGFLFRVEKNIPLDKIQDLGLKEGPILRYLGLTSLNVETAGQSNPEGASDAALTGIVDSIAFRDAVLNQRDLAVEGLGSARPRVTVDSIDTDAGTSQTLTEIRDSLKRIEGFLERYTQR